MNEKELFEKQYGEGLLRSKGPSFPRFRILFRGLDVTRYDAALKMLRPGGSLLDVGCGDGEFLFKAQKLFNECYGVDISPSRLRTAASRLTSHGDGACKIFFQEVNLNQELPFQHNFFDSAVCLAVIAFVFDPYALVTEIHRVLRPNAHFIVEIPNIAYIKYRLKLLFGGLPSIVPPPPNWKDIGWDGGHLHYFTQKTFCGLLEDCGFSLESVSGTGFLANLRNVYPSLLTGGLCIKARKKKGT